MLLKGPCYLTAMWKVAEVVARCQNCGVGSLLLADVGDPRGSEAGGAVGMTSARSRGVSWE
jgi:hypothetical protein